MSVTCAGYPILVPATPKWGEAPTAVDPGARSRGNPADPLQPLPVATDADLMIIELRRRAGGLGVVATVLTVATIGMAVRGDEPAPRVAVEAIDESGAGATPDRGTGPARPDPRPRATTTTSTPTTVASPPDPSTTAPPTTTATTPPPVPSTPRRPAPTPTAATTPPATAAPTTAPPPPTTAPPPPPSTVAPGNLAAATQHDLLAQVNARRATGVTCGGAWYPAVPALTLDGRLGTAAQRHAMDMAAAGYFSHTGRDGSSPGDRITAAGYRWRAWSENIAAGQSTTTAVVDGWFGSAGHCQNFMSRHVTQVGFGMVQDPSSQYRIYWVADLAGPA